MESFKSALVFECQRLDFEHEVIRSIKNELEQNGRFLEAEDIEEAEQHVLQAIDLIKKSAKYLSNKPMTEQIKINLDL